jgi:hypothetical protein
MHDCTTHIMAHRRRGYTVRTTHGIKPCYWLFEMQIVLDNSEVLRHPFPQPVRSVSKVWQPLLVADSGTAVLYMSAFASLCKRYTMPAIIGMVYKPTMKYEMHHASQTCTNGTCSNGAVFGVSHNHPGLATSKDVDNRLMMLMVCIHTIQHGCCYVCSHFKLSIR